MTDWIELDPAYSTSRRVVKADPQVIAALVKQSHNPEDKFETVLFLPGGEGRQGEGGLRTKGYFKTAGIIPSPLSEDTSAATKPLITVVTVVFNGEKFLEETILSIINQTYDNVEYLIIDGGSTDGTLDIIKKYEHAIDYWVSEKDKGIYDAMNKGIDLATGEWINFMNAGDMLLKIPAGYLNADADLVYGNEKNATGVQQPKPIRLIKYGEMFACHQAMFFRLSEINHYTNYKIYADYHLVMEMFLNKKKFIYINETICLYADGGVSSVVSNTKRKEKYKSIFNGFGFVGLLKSIVYRGFRIEL